MAAEIGAAADVSCYELVESVIKSKRNSNKIIDLEKLLISEDENVVLSAQDGAGKLFSYFIENGNFLIPGAGTERSEADEKYCQWLKEQYDEVKSLLCDHLHDSRKNIREPALITLMKLVKAEGENPVKTAADSTWYFPKEIFQLIIKSIVSHSKDMQDLILSFRGFTGYNDIRLYTLKAILTLFESNAEVSSIFLHNIFYLLSHVQFPREFLKQGTTVTEGNTFIDDSTGNHPAFKLKCTVFKKVFSTVWIKFLTFKLPTSLYKNVLISLHQDVLPHLTNPLLLTDFLTDSYNVGGAVSLLALNGLFFLIQKYNLEYPNFYQKLYALFQPDIITSKYRARFFFLSDLFLTSTHLPSYLVAAFVKRLGRLALVSPPHVLLIIIPFIGNLLIRHPSLKVLIHCPGKLDITDDPYNSEEPDPAKCFAIDSSLWEIKSLQNHWHPDVSRKAKFLNKALPQMEWNISSTLEVDIDDLIEKESNINFVDAPMSFDKPLGLFQSHEDRMCDLWTL